MDPREILDDAGHFKERLSHQRISCGSLRQTVPLKRS
jgi:hypothetical protein